MGISELETVVRLGLPMVIVVYDDEAYGAEVHHFRPGRAPAGHRPFPPADLAQIGRGFGCDGVTVRSRGRPRAGQRLAGRPDGPPARDRREGHLRARLLVAGGGLPRPLTGCTHVKRR